MISEYDRTASALDAMPSDDRDEWVRCAMAVKHMHGDDGYELWDRWSRRSEKYQERVARSTWRSVKADGGITGGYLYWLASSYGWAPTDEQRALPPPKRYGPRKPDPDGRRERERAAERAKDLIYRSVRMKDHPYMLRKGFRGVESLVLGGREDAPIVVPVQRVERGILQSTSVQLIAPDGAKRFLRGSSVLRGRYKMLGSERGRAETLYVEGYATGLSVRAACREAHWHPTIAICFSAANLVAVARDDGRRRAAVVADRDDSEVGEQAALKTGLPYWLPPEGDANDYHQRAGLDALVSEMRTLRRRMRR